MRILAKAFTFKPVEENMSSPEKLKQGILVEVFAYTKTDMNKLHETAFPISL